MLKVIFLQLSIHLFILGHPHWTRPGEALYAGLLTARSWPTGSARRTGADKRVRDPTSRWQPRLRLSWPDRCPTPVGRQGHSADLKTLLMNCFCLTNSPIIIGTKIQKYLAETRKHSCNRKVSRCGETGSLTRINIVAASTINLTADCCYRPGQLAMREEGARDMYHLI